MANNKRIPNYRRMYPDASEEVIAVLRQSERKQQYHEYDLKAERFKMDEAKQKAYFIPGREDSLERLLEADVQFKDNDTSVEDTVIKAIMIQQLKESIELLSSDEIEMINALFYRGLTEREYAQISGIPQKTINDRKLRTLRKLKKLLET